MKKRALALLALCLLPGCDDAIAPSPAVIDPEPRFTEPLDALSRRLGRARQRMRARGYDELPWSSRIFLPSDGAKAQVVRLRRGTCTTFLALSGGSMRELELALFDRNGRRIAVDAVRGEGSLVHACPRQERGARRRATYYLTARAKGGAGAVSFRAFESETGAGTGFAGVFDGIISSPDDHREALEQRLARTMTRLKSRDMRPIGGPIVTRVLEGEALRVREALVAGHCYVAVTRTVEEVKDLVVYLLDPHDTEVARDLGVDDEARLAFCASETGVHVFEARASEGSGDVGLVILEDPSAEPSEAPAVEVVAEQLPSERDEPQVWGAALAALSRRGYGEPHFVAENAPVRPGEIVTHEVSLPTGCSVIIAAPASADTDLDLYLRTEDEIALRDTRITAEARLVSCRDRPQTYQATVKAYGRDGRYWLALLPADPGMTDVGHLRLLDAIEPYSSRGYVQQRSEVLAAGEGSQLRSVSLEAGECVAFAAAGTENVEDVDLELRDASGRVVASDTGPDAWASVSRCAQEATRFEVRAFVYRGAGDVLLETWRRGG